MSETITLEIPAQPVTLTPAAVQQVRRIMKKQNMENACLRVGVKGGGCSGLSYVLMLDDAPTPRDVVYEVEGLTVVVDKKSARFLNGTTLDYCLQNLLEGGWKWTNPNAARSCGCGTSFAPKSG
jgi:iron-sulfur cluster assembly protein